MASVTTTTRYFQSRYKMPENLKTELAKIVQQGQRQDGGLDQLRDLHAFAVRLGLYDAADIIKTMTEKRG
jgi:hypothetical protein